MDLSLKERFARLGPIRAIDQNHSGSTVLLGVYRPDERSQMKTIDAIFALRQRGITTLKAKRAMEEVVAKGVSVVILPCVENLDDLLGDLNDAGFMARRLKVPERSKLKVLRARLGMTREQFALRYGLSIENVRNWEEGRRPIDSTARSYLAAIANDPENIPIPYEVALSA